MKIQQPLPPQQLFTLGDRLKEARKFRKFSQQKLGKLIDISQSAVGQCERGITKEFTPSNLLRAADALDVNPIWLVTGKGTMLDRSPETDSLAIRIQELDEGQRAMVMALVEYLLSVGQPASVDIFYSKKVAMGRRA